MKIVPKRYYLENIFDEFLISGTANLKCDIYEKNNCYFLEADIPGFKKDEICIEAEEGYLTIKAAKGNDNVDEGKNYLRRERSYASHKRQFYLGNIDEDNIKAELIEGILTITVPKKEEISNIKKVEIV